MVKLEKLQNDGKPYDEPVYQSFKKEIADKLLGMKRSKWRAVPEKVSPPKPTREKAAKPSEESDKK